MTPQTVQRQEDIPSEIRFVCIGYYPLGLETGLKEIIARG